eukprot:scaffold566689_cov26-Prasinocladus_malaysianus.AAC.1
MNDGTDKQTNQQQTNGISKEAKKEGRKGGRKEGRRELNGFKRPMCSFYGYCWCIHQGFGE